MLRRIVDAFNAIGDETWAFLWLIYGSAFYLICGRLKVDSQIAAGIVGAALALFQKASRSQNTYNAPNADKQIVNPPQPPAD